MALVRVFVGLGFCGARIFAGLWFLGLRLQGVIVRLGFG